MTSKMDEKAVKSFIRSLLTSNPLDSTIRQLKNDFKTMIGMDIPFQNFGYNSAEHFLKSITDTCQVQGTGDYALVKPIITEKVAHINEMVTKQKVDTKRTRHGRRAKNHFMQQAKPQPHHTYMRRNNFDRYSLSPCTSIDTSSTNDSSYAKKDEQLPWQSKKTEPVPSQENTSVKPTIIYAGKPGTTTGRTFVRPNNTAKLAATTTNFTENYTTPTTSTSQTYTPNRLPSHTNTVNQTEEYRMSHRQNGSAHHKTEPQHRTETTRLEPEYEDDSYVPNKVQNNLKELIKQFPDGIWCRDIPKYYSNTFKKDIRYLDYGYRSLIEMCMSLKHIFHYVRPGTEDFKLYDRNQPLPKGAERTFTMASYSRINQSKNKASALPDIDWDDFLPHIPPDTFPFGEEIPRQFLPEGTKVEDILEVVVVEVYDPSKFWFYLKDSPLDELMDEMQQFYRSAGVAEQYEVPDILIREGLYCVQVIFGEYHRALIMDTLSDVPGFVRLIYIDYGTMAKAPIEGLCFLDKKFSELPAQAIRCRLSNVVPPDEGCPWSRESTQRFRQLLSGRDTKIKIAHIDNQQEFVMVFLADVTKSESGDVYYLNEMLVKEGLAKWVDEERNILPIAPNYDTKVHFLHLFPTFLELEYGLAPSTTEVFALQDLNVPINFYYPQYFTLKDNEIEDLIHHTEETYIENSKSQRQLNHLGKFFDITKTKTGPNEIDFTVFGEMDIELRNFYYQTEENNEQEEINEELFCDYEEEIETLEDKVAELNVEEDLAIKQFKKKMELSENLIQEINAYISLEESPSSSIETVDDVTVMEYKSDSNNEPDIPENHESRNEDCIGTIHQTQNMYINGEELEYEKERRRNLSTILERTETSIISQELEEDSLEHYPDEDDYFEDCDDNYHSVNVAINTSNHILASIDFNDSSSTGSEEAATPEKDAVASPVRPNGRTKIITNLRANIKKDSDLSESFNSCGQFQLPVSLIEEKRDLTLAIKKEDSDFHIEELQFRKEQVPVHSEEATINSLSAFLSEARIKKHNDLYNEPIQSCEAYQVPAHSEEETGDLISFFSEASTNIDSKENIELVGSEEKTGYLLSTIFSEFNVDRTESKINLGNVKELLSTLSENNPFKDDLEKKLSEEIVDNQEEIVPLVDDQKMIYEDEVKCDYEEINDDGCLLGAASIEEAYVVNEVDSLPDLQVNNSRASSLCESNISFVTSNSKNSTTQTADDNRTVPYMPCYMPPTMPGPYMPPYPVPQYPQWSNNYYSEPNRYPPYPHYYPPCPPMPGYNMCPIPQGYSNGRPANTTRPPPGFAPLMPPKTALNIAAAPFNMPPSPYNMPPGPYNMPPGPYNMPPGMFYSRQPYGSSFYGRGPPICDTMTSSKANISEDCVSTPERKDFYDFYNEQLLKNMDQVLKREME